jgi:hypothetical protein
METSNANKVSSQNYTTVCQKRQRACFKYLKGLSHEIDFKNFDQNLKNLT